MRHPKATIQVLMRDRQPGTGDPPVVEENKIEPAHHQFAYSEGRLDISSSDEPTRISSGKLPCSVLFVKKEPGKDSFWD